MVPLSGSDVSAQDIEQLLRTLGASPVYAGFTPAVTALQYVLADQQLLTSLTTRLYPKVAESCEIALPCVERNIPYNDCSHLGEESNFYSRLLLDIA